MTATLQEIRLSQIKPHKHNPRRAIGDVAELAASIAEQGVVEPLIVAPNGTGDTYVLIAGHRRLAAAKVQKLKTVPCLIRDDLADEKSQIETMLVENLQRTDLSPVEEAHAYQQLLEFPGYTQQKIAKTTGRAIATVRQRIKMTKLPKSALSKIHAGQISLAHAIELADFADTPYFKDLERSAGTPNFPYALERAKRDRANDRKVAKAKAELEDAGVRVVDQPSWTEPTRFLHGDAVDEHRGCEGFAAYIGWNGSVTYICDKPQLHGADPEDEDDPHDNEYQRTREQLADVAAARRAHLGEFLNRDDIAGIALDVLRQHVLNHGKNCTFLGAVLNCDWSSGKERTKVVGELELDQLAILVDLIDHSNHERALESDYGYGLDSYSDTYKTWRTRLTDVYGYRWSSFEQELLDRAAEKKDAAAAGSEEVGDVDDE